MLARRPAWQLMSPLRLRLALPLGPARHYSLAAPGASRAPASSSSSLRNPAKFSDNNNNSCPRTLPHSLSCARFYSTSKEAEDIQISALEFRDVFKCVQEPGIYTIIDVREPHELKATGKIPNAINIPITSAPHSFHLSKAEFEQFYGFEKPDKGKDVVIYCKAGVRSRAASEAARDAGFTKIAEYPGSWNDWVANRGRIESV